MTKQIDLTKYSEFVEAVTSRDSNDLTSFINRLDYLDGMWDDKLEEKGPMIHVPLLLTSAIGLGSESGEFQEIVKKLFFQGKPLTEETKFHMVRELGDVIWYWTNACRALNVDPNDVISENVTKLKARYPSGDFDPFYSENRKEGDL
jgi:NTP pyrophosphatase (non-canonical NTP hydrolase)